jgi:hypothetical protein
VQLEGALQTTTELSAAPDGKRQKLTNSDDGEPDVPSSDGSSRRVSTTDRQPAPAAPVTPPPQIGNAHLGAPGTPLTPVSFPVLQKEIERAQAVFGSVELAVLSIMRRFDFSIDDLQRALAAGRYELSFSRVTYKQMAPLYGFNPVKLTDDWPTFLVSRARLPGEVFLDIVQDMNLVLNQYGDPMAQKTEIARSSYLSPMFNRIVAHFRLLINNTPETLLEGRLTSKGRIEYQFRAFGALTVLFIEVKLRLGTPEERANYIAQVSVQAQQ